MDLNSMLYWYPMLEQLELPLPETKIVKLLKTDRELMPVCDGDMSPLDGQKAEILAAADAVGYPLFMRTDQFSGKHTWTKTCFVPDEGSLFRHIAALFEESFMADMCGLPIKALVFRKYIQMDSLFVAFYGDMPVNPEYRFFVKDGKVLCHHWYWVKEAIQEGFTRLPPDWRQLLRSTEVNTQKELPGLIKLAERVSKAIPGAWSVDFCRGRDGTWWLIDMAVAADSWHPDCVIKEE